MASSNVVATSLNSRAQIFDKQGPTTKLGVVASSFFLGSATTTGSLSAQQGYQISGQSSLLPNNMRNKEHVMNQNTSNNTTNPENIPALQTPEAKEQQQIYGRIVLDISNSVLPLAKLATTPSSNDGLVEDDEGDIRSLGCDSIQLMGKLLKLPQVQNYSCD